jgi:hypothetical protein
MNIFFSFNKGEPVMEQTYVEKLDSYRSVDLGVFYQYVSSTANNLFRIWSPVNRRFAQFWEINKQDEDESFEITASSVGTGLAEYFKLSQGTTSGTFTNYGTANTAFTTQIGATISITFTGTGIRLMHYATTNGGEWSFVVDGGSPVIISCYNASDIQRLQTIATDLSYGSHSVVGTFIGNGAVGYVSANGAATTGYNVEYKSFWIEGSDSPNYCFDRGLITSSDRPVTFGLNSGGHYNLSYSGIKDGQPHDDARFIPVHGANPPGAATFANLTTDRFLKADGGSDIINSQVIYGFATPANEIIFYQKYKGHSYTHPSDELIEIAETWTFDKTGFHLNIDLEILQPQYVTAAFAPMFSILYANAKTLLFTGSELDLTVDYSVQNEFILPENFDGNLATVNKTGTDTFKSLVFAYRLFDPQTALQLDTDYNQVVYVRTIAGTIQKIYPTQFSQVGLNPFSFSYQAKYAVGFIPDAYNVLGV